MRCVKGLASARLGMKLNHAIKHALSLKVRFMGSLWLLEAVSSLTLTVLISRYAAYSKGGLPIHRSIL